LILDALINWKPLIPNINTCNANHLTDYTKMGKEWPKDERHKILGGVIYWGQNPKEY
jgi:hypothetical protein